MAGINVVSGLASGLDWRKIIDQLKALERRKIETVESRKKAEQDRHSAWQALSAKLLSLKTAAADLKATTAFNLFSTSLASNTATDAKDLLSVTAGTSAAPGTYQLVVNSLAAAQKLSSTSYASQTAALGLSGDLVAGGRTVRVSATDTLSGLRDKINAANTGTDPSRVTASIVNYGSGGYRLILTSDREGAAGISLLNGGSTDLLGTLGFVDGAEKTVKNALAGGHRSDSFSAADKAVGGTDLLNLSSAQSGSVTLTINGSSQSVAIDLAADSLNAIRDSINTAFGSAVASVVSASGDRGNTTYRLLIEGSAITYTDANNVLETLGILKRAGVSDERGLTGDVANTSGGRGISASTLIKDIDGYNDYASGDAITLTGTDTSGAAVNSVFTLTDATTVSDLLTEIQSRYGNVTASITADGKVRVVDHEIGDTDLSVILTPSKSTVKFDSDHDLGALSTLRKREIQAGADASLSVDGVPVTPSSNSVADVIPGLTLNLRKADPETTVSLTVGRDHEAVKEKISGFVTAYNDLTAAISVHLSYDAAAKKPGGALFGDSTLRTVKSSLSRLLLTKVSGVNEDFSTLGLVGISLDKNGKLSIDDEELQGHLQSNFQDVQRLFAADWSSSSSEITYIRHSYRTQAGTYSLQVSGVNPVEGYFAAPGDAGGSGDVLTGISGDAAGLVARYSGASTGAVGSLTLTFGVAELVDRAVYRVADSVYGYLPNKQQAIQDAIGNYDQEIRTLEDRLERKMEDLERRFIAMESALGVLQSMSSWLSGQINALQR